MEGRRVRDSDINGRASTWNQTRDRVRLGDREGRAIAGLGGAVAGAARRPVRIGDAAADNEYHYRERGGKETSLLELQFHFLSLI
jgi:hypothetical protein